MSLERWVSQGLGGWGRVWLSDRDIGWINNCVAWWITCFVSQPPGQLISRRVLVALCDTVHHHCYTGGLSLTALVDTYVGTTSEDHWQDFDLLAIELTCWNITLGKVHQGPVSSTNCSGQVPRRTGLLSNLVPKQTSLLSQSSKVYSVSIFM